jgi:uncharacterized protein YndB with AHSA1/START domain
MRTTTSVEIDRPIAEVFDYTTTQVAEWSITCVEDVPLEERPGGVGSTFRIVTEERGRRMQFQGVVTRHEPPKVSAVFLEGEHFDIDVLYSFESLSGRTRVTQESQVYGKGFLRVLFLLLGWLMKKSGCKAQAAELESLKKHCERRAQPGAAS